MEPVKNRFWIGFIVAAVICIAVYFLLLQPAADVMYKRKLGALNDSLKKQDERYEAKMQEIKLKKQDAEDSHAQEQAVVIPPRPVFVHTAIPDDIAEQGRVLSGILDTIHW